MSDQLDDALAEIRAGKPRPFYLIHGEEYLGRRAAEALCEALVPKDLRDLNLTQVDASVGAREVAKHLDTVPMFRGAKAVFVDGADLLFAKRDIAKELARAKELWGQPHKKKDAARRVLALVAPAGWTYRELDPDAPGAPSKTKWKKEVGFEPDDRAFFSEVAAFAAEHELKAPKDDQEALLKSVTAGPPKGNHLVVLCEDADLKHPVARAIAERGLILKRAPEQDFKKRGIEGLDISQLALEVLTPLGKKLTPGAMQSLKGRVGGAMRQLASELEKLALYVGDRASIEERDVELLVAPVREEEFFELGHALGERDTARALELVDDDLARGKAGLMILGGLTAAVRRLAHDAARFSKLKGALAGRDLSYRDFQATLYSQYSELCAGERAPHPYAAWSNYRAVRRHGVRRLLGALSLCAEVDQKLKRGGDPELELERLVLAVCA